jgi:histone H3/H4
MARKKKGGRTPGGRNTFVVASKVKSYVRQKSFMASSELADALSHRVQALLDDAIVRCNNNGRRTVRPHDI